MSADEDDDALVWTNLLGLGPVAALLGTFAVSYGQDFLSYLIFLLRPGPGLRPDLEDACR